jgi:hypothetical protein
MASAIRARNWKGPIVTKSPSTLHRAASAASLALVLVASGLAASTAFAQQADLNQLYHTGQNTDFGAQQDASVLRAAGAAPSTTPLTAEQTKTLTDAFRVGQNDAFGAGRDSQPGLSLREYQSRIASTAPTIGKRDLVGDHGRQDQLAREIYQPGSRPAGW